MGVRLSDELVEFVESGISTTVGTRDAGLRPECLRAMGASVSSDRQHISVYLNQALAARTLENLDNNGAIAVIFSRPLDNRAVQIKGRSIETRVGGDADRALQERYLAGWVEQLYCVMIPRAVTRRMRIWPSVVVTFAVDELFSQTPGPAAGARLERFA